MKKALILIWSIALICAMFPAAHAENVLQIAAQTEDADGPAAFYTGASAGKLYLCEACAHRIYAISPDGALAQSSSITALDDTGARYLSPLALVSDEKRAYAVSMTANQSEDGLRFEGAGLYEMDEAGRTGAQVCALDLSDAILSDGDAQELLPCLSAVMGENALYLLFDRGEGGWDESQAGRLLLRFDLASGKKDVRELTGVLQLIRADAKRVLCARAAEAPSDTIVQIFNVHSGEIREVTTLSGSGDRPRNIVYNPSQDCVFYSVANQIWGIPKVGREARRIGLLPTRRPSGLFDPGDGDKLYAYDSQSAYILPIDWSQNVQTRKFVVSGGSGDVENYARLHPELEIEYLDMDSREIVDAILTQSSVPDLFVIRSEDLIFSALREKGYLLPLDGEKSLRYAEALHPDIRSHVCVGGVPCAIPTSADFQPVLGVNTALWQRLNLGDLPECWPELLDWIQGLEGRSAALPEIRLMDAVDAADARACFLRRLIEDYESSWIAPERAGYDSADFRALAGQIEAIQWERFSFSADIPLENTLFQFNCLPTLQVRHEHFAPLPLGIDKNSPPVLAASLNIVAVNPYSQNREVALDYVNYVVENLDPVSRIELCPAANDPLKLDGIQSEIDSLNAKMEALRQRISAETDAAEQRALEWEREALEKELQSALDNPWRVSPDEIARFRLSSQRIYMRNEIGLDADTRSNILYNRDRLMHAEISVDEFISEVDRQISMQFREGA